MSTSESFRLDWIRASNTRVAIFAIACGVVCAGVGYAFVTLSGQRSASGLCRMDREWKIDCEFAKSWSKPEGGVEFFSPSAWDDAWLRGRDVEVATRDKLVNATLHIKHAGSKCPVPADVDVDIQGVVDRVDMKNRKLWLRDCVLIPRN